MWKEAEETELLTARSKFRFMLIKKSRGLPSSLAQQINQWSLCWCSQAGCWCSQAVFQEKIALRKSAYCKWGETGKFARQRWKALWREIAQAMFGVSAISKLGTPLKPASRASLNSCSWIDSSNKICTIGAVGVWSRLMPSCPSPPVSVSSTEQPTLHYQRCHGKKTGMT